MILKRNNVLMLKRNNVLMLKRNTILMLKRNNVFTENNILMRPGEYFGGALVEKGRATTRARPRPLQIQCAYCTQQVYVCTLHTVSICMHIAHSTYASCIYEQFVKRGRAAMRTMPKHCRSCMRIAHSKYICVYYA